MIGHYRPVAHTLRRQPFWPYLQVALLKSNITEKGKMGIRVEAHPYGVYQIQIYAIQQSIDTVPDSNDKNGILGVQDGTNNADHIKEYRETELDIVGAQNRETNPIIARIDFVIVIFVPLKLGYPFKHPKVKP